MERLERKFDSLHVNELQAATATATTQPTNNQQQTQSYNQPYNQQPRQNNNNRQQQGRYNNQNGNQQNRQQNSNGYQQNNRGQYNNGQRQQQRQNGQQRQQREWTNSNGQQQQQQTHNNKIQTHSRGDLLTKGHQDKTKVQHQNSARSAVVPGINEGQTVQPSTKPATDVSVEVTSLTAAGRYNLPQTQHRRPGPLDDKEQEPAVATRYHLFLLHTMFAT